MRGSPLLIPWLAVSRLADPLLHWDSGNNPSGAQALEAVARALTSSFQAAQMRGAQGGEGSLIC
jgi:hypothetical protein